MGWRHLYQRRMGTGAPDGAENEKGARSGPPRAAALPAYFTAKAFFPAEAPFRKISTS